MKNHESNNSGRADANQEHYCKECVAPIALIGGKWTHLLSHPPTSSDTYIVDPTDLGHEAEPLTVTVCTRCNKACGKLPAGWSHTMIDLSGELVPDLDENRNHDCCPPGSRLISKAAKEEEDEHGTDSNALETYYSADKFRLLIITAHERENYEEDEQQEICVDPDLSVEAFDKLLAYMTECGLMPTAAPKIEHTTSVRSDVLGKWFVDLREDDEAEGVTTVSIPCPSWLAAEELASTMAKAIKTALAGGEGREEFQAVAPFVVEDVLKEGLDPAWGSPVVAASRIVAALPPSFIAYAGNGERRGWVGFAALHDLCDANMLLPGAETHNTTNPQWLSYANAVMSEVTKMLKAHPIAQAIEGSQP